MRQTGGQKDGITILLSHSVKLRICGSAIKTASNSPHNDWQSWHAAYQTEVWHWERRMRDLSTGCQNQDPSHRTATGILLHPCHLLTDY